MSRYVRVQLVPVDHPEHAELERDVVRAVDIARAGEYLKANATGRRYIGPSEHDILQAVVTAGAQVEALPPPPDGASLGRQAGNAPGETLGSKPAESGSVESQGEQTTFITVGPEFPPAAVTVEAEFPAEDAGPVGKADFAKWWADLRAGRAKALCPDCRMVTYAFLDNQKPRLTAHIGLGSSWQAGPRCPGSGGRPVYALEAVPAHAATPEDPARFLDINGELRYGSPANPAPLQGALEPAQPKTLLYGASRAEREAKWARHRWQDRLLAGPAPKHARPEPDPSLVDLDRLTPASLVDPGWRANAVVEVAKQLAGTRESDHPLPSEQVKARAIVETFLVPLEEERFALQYRLVNAKKQEARFEEALHSHLLELTQAKADLARVQGEFTHLRAGIDQFVAVFQNPGAL